MTRVGENSAFEHHGWALEAWIAGPYGSSRCLASLKPAGKNLPGQDVSETSAFGLAGMISPGVTRPLFIILLPRLFQPRLVSNSEYTDCLTRRGLLREFHPSSDLAQRSPHCIINGENCLDQHCSTAKPVLPDTYVLFQASPQASAKAYTSELPHRSTLRFRTRHSAEYPPPKEKG